MQVAPSVLSQFVFVWIIFSDVTGATVCYALSSYVTETARSKIDIQKKPMENDKGILKSTFVHFGIQVMTEVW